MKQRIWLAVLALVMLGSCGPNGHMPVKDGLDQLESPLRFRATIIYVKSVRKTVAWYEKAFGLERKFLDKKGHYAEMQTGDTILAFGSYLYAKANLKTPFRKHDLKVKPAAVEIAFKTKYVQPAYERAVAAGATSIVEPKTKDWGQVVAYVRDLNGFTVAIASETEIDLSSGKAFHLSTILAVADLSKSHEFYTQAFGWKLRVDAPVYKEFLLPNGRGIGLYQRESFAHNTGQLPEQIGSGKISATELYFHVPDLAAAMEKLTKAGARKLSDPAPRDWGDEVAYFADPDGNVIAIARPLPGPERDKIPEVPPTRKAPESADGSVVE